MYHSLFIHSPAEGHLGSLQALTIMSKATVNIHCKIFVGISFQLLWVNTKECEYSIVWYEYIESTCSGGSDGKDSACNVGDLGSIPGLGRSLEEGNGNSLQYSCLENSMDKGAWEATVQGVSKRQTQLSNQHTHMVRVYLVCETSPNYLPKWLYHLHSY